MKHEYQNARGRSRLHGPLLSLAGALTVLLATLAAAPSALAGLPATTKPHWSLESRAAPTNLPLNGNGEILVTASNIGDAPMNSTITITDTLPEKIEATSASLSSNHLNPSQKVLREKRAVGSKCTIQPGSKVVVCTLTSGLPLAPYEELTAEINVKVVNASPTELPNHVTVEGGEAEPAELTRPLQVNGATTSFGLESYTMTPESEKFEPDVNAGSHPFQLTTTFNLNERYEADPEAGERFFPTAPALERNLSFREPAGLLADANALPQCPDVNFGSQGEQFTNACPNDSVLGVAVVTVFNPTATSEFYATYTVPVFNLAPAAGEPLRFGFSVLHVPVVLDASVRTGEDYGGTVTVKNAPQAVQLLSSKVTFWGIPSDPRHLVSRGWACFGYGEAAEQEPCEHLDSNPPTPLLRLPTTCEKLKAPVQGTAWNGEVLGGREEEKRGGELPEVPNETPTQLTGLCSGLPFEPTLEVEPETQSASTPTGLNVRVKVPQETTLEQSYEAKDEADVSATKLELPIGLQVSAGAANGLMTCDTEASGFLGNVDPKTLQPKFNAKELEEQTGEKLEGELTHQGFTPAAASCPEAAKVGTVNISTPFLEKELVGAVYLAHQDTNPFASPLVAYLIAEEAHSKVRVKLAGEVQISLQTGQLVSDFKGTPQAPFETLKIHLWNGPRASQATPAQCGAYSSKATFTASDGTEETAKSAESVFHITSGPNGTPCPGAKLPFEPSFKTQSNAQAGAFTPFTLKIKRPDGDAAVKTISMTLPPGQAAVLASVPLCPEPQAAEGNCPAGSKIGTSIARSGLGSAPVELKGNVYLTGPYNGAPFGLSSVTEAEAGPFKLGRIVVRSSISVNKFTTAATVNTEAAQFFPLRSVAGEQTQFAGLPAMVKGTPAQLKELEVSINREGFEFNPTNCGEGLKITGQLTGYEEGSAAVSENYPLTGCNALPFEPKLTASVAAQGSKENGTEFKVTVESPGLGQANIHKVDLTIPSLLPSRLTTIQKACLAATFEANPASCDEGSVIGKGIVHTPVFKNPLMGPAYLVSHGAAAFPDVEFVLQGEGVEVILDGKTDIKNKVTYSKFETSPDAPFSKFESIFPAGPHSALTTNVPEIEKYNLCKHTLTVPTEITAQNGAFISQTTPVALVGCGGVENEKTFKPRIKKHSIKGSTLTLVVEVPTSGRLTVSGGSALRTLKKSISKKGTYTLKLHLGPKGAAAVAHKRPLKVHVRVALAPTKGKGAPAGVTVKFP
jgi:uncharacterized repeat protein (TIGR01451 family)